MTNNHARRDALRDFEFEEHERLTEDSPPPDDLEPLAIEPVALTKGFSFLPEPWMTSARCANSPDPEQYAIDRLPRQGHNRRLAARRLCHGCPTFADCAWFGFRTESTDHIYAGVIVPFQRNESQRAQLFSIAARAGRVPRGFSTNISKGTA